MTSKKNELIQKYPDWAAILENPDTDIAKLFQQSNWQMIGNLLDANIDQEINRLLIKHLYQQVGTGIRKDLQIQMIEKGNADTLLYLVKYTFSRPHLNPRTPEQEVLWKSLGIENAMERKSFIVQELQKIGPPFVDKTKSLPSQKNSSQLQPGDQILISNRIMKVIKKAGEGRRGVVFQVQARESEKAQQWRAGD